MLGFGKKKKKDADAATSADATAKAKDAIAVPPGKKDLKKDAKKGKGQSEKDETIEKAPLPEKKKFITKKRIFIILMILGAIGGSAFLVYRMYFTEKSTEGAKIAVYNKMVLAHVKLPEEMLKFSFKHFPDLYLSLVSYNKEITIFDSEIARIEAIAQKYPEQKKITETGKKILNKGKKTLVKAFVKLQKPIRETYVLFQVNESQGIASITEKKEELTRAAQAALKISQEQTQNIKTSSPKEPGGIFAGTLHKLKKKFL